MTLRPMTIDDHLPLTAIMNAIVREGNAFVFESEFDADRLGQYLAGYPIRYTAEIDGRVVGAYILRPNQAERGSHIANGTYLVDASVQGKGIGRRLGEHSIEEARKRGFRAIQFNAVVSTNTPAVALWMKLGFEVIGTVPDGFRRGDGRLVDLLILYRKL